MCYCVIDDIYCSFVEGHCTLLTESAMQVKSSQGLPIKLEINTVTSILEVYFLRRFHNAAHHSIISVHKWHEHLTWIITGSIEIVSLCHYMLSVNKPIIVNDCATAWWLTGDDWKCVWLREAGAWWWPVTCEPIHLLSNTSFSISVYSLFIHFFPNRCEEETAGPFL